FELLFDRLRLLLTAEAQIHEIDIEIDAVVEGLEQAAELPSREDLDDVDLGLRGEAAQHPSRLVAGGDDASRMRPVTDDVQRPGLGICAIGEVEAVTDVADERVAPLPSPIPHVHPPPSA